MNWISQKEGIIDHFREKIFSGTQPIRVLHPIVFEMFKATNPTFFQQLSEEIKAGRLNRQLRLTTGEDAISNYDGTYKTPKVYHETREIELHETFMSYLWCIVYAVYVLYIETIDYPSVNKANGHTTYPISQDNIDAARGVFDCARHIIAYYDQWDKDVYPNPEKYLAEKRDYVEQANLYYTDAVKFILCHEFTHLKLHVDHLNSDTPNSHYLDYEWEADNSAIDLIVLGMPSNAGEVAFGQKMASELGIVFGILSMFFFRATTDGKRHPNSEDRLSNALNRLNLAPEHPAWGIACIGLELWDEQFGLSFNWDRYLPNYKQLYYNIVAQIKARQS